MRVSYILILLFILFGPSLSVSNVVCSSVLFSLKTHKFNVGRNKGRSMAYRIDTPSKWNGKTVILNQGFTRNMRYWDKQTSFLILKGFQVFRYDPFNIGNTLKVSGVLSTEQGFSFGDNAHAVTEILKKENITSDVFVVGHSLGAARAIGLAKMLSFQLEGKFDENSVQQDAVLGVLIASPFVNYLEGHYIEESTNRFASPFLAPNLWPSGTSNPFLDSMSSFVDNYNLGVSAFLGIGVSNFTTLSSSTAINLVIEEGLNDRSPVEETGIDRETEKAALLQILESSKSVEVEKTIGFIKSDIHLLTGTREGLLVPEAMLNKLKASAPRGMSHTVIDSDHMTPESSEFYSWLERLLEN